MEKRGRSWMVFAMVAIAGLLAVCMLFGACGKEDTPPVQEPSDDMAVAYLEYAQNKDESNVEEVIVQVAGEFSGNTVFMGRLISNEWEVPAVVTKYYVDGILVCELPQPDYEVMVCTASVEISSLDDAYAEGLVTKADLRDIAAAFHAGQK